MKFIVIGLGYFGATLASSLTEQGHEVIGIDNRWERIDELKNSITHVMEMDTTSENAVRSLPLDDVDAVIVAIGEDVGSSILTLSILKKIGIKRIIGRVISPIHQSIINQIGIEETVHPEAETALAIRSKLQIKDAIKITELDSNLVIAEIFLPKKYVGHTLPTINMENRFNLKLIAVKPAPKSTGYFSQIKNEYHAHLDYDQNKTLREKDILVILGKPNDLIRLTSE